MASDEFIWRDGLGFVSSRTQWGEMRVFGNQIVGARSHGAIGEDIIIRIGSDDLEVK